MATQGDLFHKKLGNQVAAERVMKEVYEKTAYIQRKQWPEDWGFTIPLYKEMYNKMDLGTWKPLPEQILLLNRKDFAKFEPNPENCKPLPPTNTKLYGWKVGNSLVQPANNWIKSRPKISMHKELGWRWGSEQ